MKQPPLFFIYQEGFRQISLPPENEFRNNFEVINITSCDDGCLITTEIDLKEAYNKLTQYIGRDVVNIYCDTNEVLDGGKFTECRLTKDSYGGDCIMVWSNK